MTRVAVNLTWIAPGRVGGSEEYLARQMLGLAAAAPDVEPTLFATEAFFDAHPELVGFEQCVAPFRRDRRAVRLAVEHTWLAARTRGHDVVHHGGGTVPFVGPKPVLATVHDLQYLEYPHHFGRVRRGYLERAMPPSMRRASAVATPSEFVRDTVVDAFGVDPARVVIVPHGVPDLDRPTDEVRDAVLRRHGLAGRPYVVYPAITHPHKRHDILIDMVDRLDPEMCVVLIGGVGDAEAAVAARIAASPHADRIVRPGRVPVAERDALVAGADALVFPSEYEGFGAPLVEAMALGVPVVCSDAPAVLEVVGDAAEIVTEASADAWADAVRSVPSQRDRLVERGALRRQRFTIERSGAALAAAYQLAIEAAS
jgi:glycosyltransferase involved in cell wall biosynthesis